MAVQGVVGFAGPRVGPAAGAGALVGSLVSSVAGSGRALAVGCAAGVDALVVAAALGAGAASRLSVFAAFGPSGFGALPGASAPPASLVPVVRAGGSVVWWAGGGPLGGRLPAPVGRLVRRSLACVRCVASGGPGSGLLLVVSGPPPRPFAPAGAGGWPSCGSGSWGSAGAAALRGLPVVVFPVGWPAFGGAGSLPALPGRGGRWVPAAVSGLWSAGWRWSPG